MSGMTSLGLPARGRIYNIKTLGKHTPPEDAKPAGKGCVMVCGVRMRNNGNRVRAILSHPSSDGLAHNKKAVPTEEFGTAERFPSVVTNRYYHDSAKVVSVTHMKRR
jgi:hypothetical protein